jgi:hypothetical protein
MNAFTINTADPSAYHDWVRTSGPIIGKSLGAQVIGICTPHAGAFEDKDLYVYMYTDTLAAAMHALPGNETMKVELSKNTVAREVRSKNLYSIVKSQSVVDLEIGKQHAFWNALVKTRDVKSYLKAVILIENAFHKNGYEDVGIQTFLGHAGNTSGMVMSSVVAPN